MMDNTIKVDSNQAEAIDEYMLYHRIVGDDDNGRTFTPAEYEAYKKRVIPMVPPFLCTRQNCKCTGFKTSVTCDCGFPAYKHTDVVRVQRIFSPLKLTCYSWQSETAEERQARGHPIGHPCVFQAMGGLTGFSSLLPGMARMDASGGPLANALSPSELDAPITERDHPFLRAHKAMIEAFEREFNSGGREKPKDDNDLQTSSNKCIRSGVWAILDEE
ncbi:unnamed protein product [Mesocestoides corti]|uniref:Protein FAM221A n=1 Tax=Mesocestoides corti TaxID=53468 RepID=A0A0R3UFI7_MESCO|nr:unnamed protein product [Mesocestoides corti]